MDKGPFLAGVQQELHFLPRALEALAVSLSGYKAQTEPLPTTVVRPAFLPFS